MRPCRILDVTAHRVHETTQNCLKIKLCPYLDHDAYRTWPARQILEIAMKCLKIRWHPSRALDTSWTWPAHRAHKLPTNA